MKAQIHWENWLSASDIAEEHAITSRYVRILIESMDVEICYSFKTDIQKNYKVIALYRLVKK